MRLQRRIQRWKRGCDARAVTISGFANRDRTWRAQMDNNLRDAEQEHEKEVPPQQSVQTSGEPPVVVQTSQDNSGGGGGMGVLAAVALVAIILVGIWWFGFGPGTGGGGGGTDTPTVPAESAAPVQSAPASAAP
jgi:hypothetical protein